MLSKSLNFYQKINKHLNLLLFVPFIVLCGIFLSSTINNYNFTNQNVDNFITCQVDPITFIDYAESNNKEIVNLYTNISATSNYKNALCIGKVIDVEINEYEIILNIGESEKFSKEISIFSLIFLVPLNFIFRAKNYKLQIFLSILIIYLTQDLLNVSNDFYNLFSKIFLITISFFLNYLFSGTESSNKFERINYREDINILRAIAVLSVLFYHAGFNLFAGGWLGVDIFFVISGYLISNIIFSEFSNKSFSFKNFYSRRIKRILPAFYYMILLTVPISYYLLAPKSMVEYLRTIVYSLFFVSNNYLSNVDFYTAEPQKLSPLLHTWSLSVEEQYYILFPLSIFLISRFFKFNLKIIYSLFLISILINLTVVNQSNLFYLIQFRAWELLLGVILMIYLNANSFSTKFNMEKIALFLIFISVFTFNDSTINNIVYKFVCLLGVSILILNNGNNNILNKVSQFNIFKKIGIISYSMYLYHQPIYAFARNYFNKEHLNIYQHAILLLTIFLFSHYSYKLIEKNHLQNFDKTKAFLMFSIFLSVLLFSYIGLKNDGYSSRFPDIPEKVVYYSIYTNLYPGEGDIDDWHDYDCNAFPIKGYNLINKNDQRGPCVYKKSQSLSNFVLIGDSHANTLSVTTIRLGEQINDNLNFIAIPGTIGRCLISGQHDTAVERYECTEVFFNNFLDTLGNQDTIAIIGRFPVWLSQTGADQYQCSINCNHIKKIQQRITSISKKVKKVILIYPVPTHPYNVAESFIYGKNIWGENIGTNIELWNEISYESNKFLDELDLTNISRIYTDKLFCNNQISNKCTVATSNELFYTDDNHLTIEGNYLIFREILYSLNN